MSEREDLTLAAPHGMAYALLCSDRSSAPPRYATYIDRHSPRWGQLCDHVRLVMEFAEAAGVRIMGCDHDSCGNAWASCEPCGRSVESIQDAYS